MRGFIISLIHFSFSILAASAVWSATFNVSNPTEFQAALTTAQSNGEDDTINVAPGTYNITSILTYTTNDGDGSLTIQAQDIKNKPILDGQNNVSHLHIHNDDDNDKTGDEGQKITIKGLIFKRGRYGGGIHVETGKADILIENSEFIENLQEGGGGVTAISDSGTITIRNNIFTKNGALGGGGVYAGTGSGTIKLLDNTFSENTADLYAGGAFLQTESGTINIRGNTFSQNTAKRNAGGLYVDSYSGLIELDGNVFSGNSALGDGSTEPNGGGGALLSANQWMVIMTNNIFYENHATDYAGGAAGVTSAGYLVITNNTFYGNTAGNKAGGLLGWLESDSSHMIIYNNIVYSNSAGGNDGDDIYVESDKDGNGTGAEVKLKNNDLTGNANFNTAQSEDLLITDTDKYSHANNIQENPLFKDPAKGNLHIKRASPCRNAGSNSALGLPSKDFDGQSRIIGGTVDIGADEYKPAEPWIPMLLLGD